jgi:hypothetical protein
MDLLCVPVSLVGPPDVAETRVSGVEPSVTNASAADL